MSAIQVQRAKNLLRDLLRDRLKLPCPIHPWVMVCIHSTYYIKIHLLCNIRDSIQAAGGMDSSILWPGKLWKTIVFLANKTRLIPGRSDHFYHCGKGQNQLIFYPIGIVPYCIPSKKEPAFLYQNRGQKNAPYIGAHASIQTVAARWYPNVSSAAIGLSLPGCAAAGVHVYGKQRTFSVLRIHTNNSGFLASCGPAAEKISGDVNPAHFFGSLFSPVRIMFGL